MEAVDVEKLLDDFEYHEERRINFASKQPALNATSFCKRSNNYTKYPRHYTAVSSHEHPSFESANSKDSHFTVTSPLPPVEVHSQHSPSDDDSGPSANFASSHPKNDVHLMATNENCVSFAFKSKDFKPDLIESNLDICTSLNEFDRFERHLPDIASTDVEIKVDEKVNFDLITNSISGDTNCNNIADSTTATIEPEIQSVGSEWHHMQEEYNKLSKIYENCANKLLIEVPSAVGVSSYKAKNEIEIKDQSESVVTEEKKITLCPSEGSERTSLNLDTYTGNVAVVEIVDKSDVNDNETENSILAPISTTLTEDPYTANDETDGEEHSQSLARTSEVIPLRENVTNNISECRTEENEKSSAIDNSVEQAAEITHKPVVEAERTCDADSEPPVVTEITCSEEQTIVSPDEDADYSTKSDESTNEITTDSQLMMKIVKAEQISTSDEAQLVNSDTIPSGSDYDESAEQPSTSEQVDEATLDETNTASTSQMKVQRPDSLNLTPMIQSSEMSSTSADSGSLLSIDERRLGKEPPVWIPDSESSVCMHCQTKFTLVRRRHHCRACGFVLCSKCCDLKASLEYLKFEEARVCHGCYSIIERVNNLESSSMKRPNPNNPMEYCSTIPPLLQVGPTQPAPPSVLVPVVGVLKREGRSKNNDTPKQVIFSDGIRPGGDLTELDAPPEPRLPLSRRHGRITKRVGTPPGNVVQHRRMLNPETLSFIPSNQDFPPLVVKKQGELVYTELEKPLSIEDEPLKFAINRNLSVLVKRIMLNCCVNRDVWCMTTEGLSCVGQDEVVFILEVLPDEKYPPKDVFSIVNMLHQEASKGSTVTELSFASAHMNQLFDSKEHGGFVFIRPTYQCVQKLLLPQPPYLIALLIHKWEAPWARLFPIRLILRLGAEYRYYPCPLVSLRNRPALFTDIGNTIIGLLADFRNYTYSLPTVRGLMIHMEDRMTTILLPRNRYDQVIRAMNNSEENVLAFAGNISTIADSHLVCIQSVQNDISYHTQAINIHNKPREVTGASFIVFNGSLKQCSWAGKSSIVEDGLMVLIPSESMISLRTALRQMNDYSIGCGPQAEERVVLKWAPDDVNFNIGVTSHIDNRPLDGVPSIRVHNGTDYSGTTTRLIRWTEVFILQSDEDSGSKTGETVNISKLSESIARATCVALVPLLDLLATANLTTLAVRATIHPENVGYEAGSSGEKLRPLYMKRLDNELIAVVHEAAVSIRDVSCPIVLELVFKIMEQG